MNTPTKNNLPQRKVPSLFIASLYNLIESQKFPQLIDWAQSKDGFVIHRPNVFAEVLLPTLCKHSNISSFIRQLNMYYFKKSKTISKDGSMVFTHPFFIKNQPDMIKNIVRKNPYVSKKSGNYEGFSDLSPSEESKCQKLINPTQSGQSESTQPEKQEQEAYATSKSMSQEKFLQDSYEEELKMMIQDFFNCDEDDFEFSEQETQPTWNSKRIKYSPESSNNESYQYVEIDFNSLNCTAFGSNQSKECLNSKLTGSSRVFHSKDLAKCQKLISTLFGSKNKNEDFSGYQNEFILPSLQELSSYAPENLFGENSFYRY